MVGESVGLHARHALRSAISNILTVCKKQDFKDKAVISRDEDETSREADPGLYADEVRADRGPSANEEWWSCLPTKKGTSQFLRDCCWAASDVPKLPVLCSFAVRAAATLETNADRSRKGGNIAS
ncbi:hypothetical protein MTO96_016343 [Rhipicephalus appendiculatus]